MTLPDPATGWFEKVNYKINLLLGLAKSSTSHGQHITQDYGRTFLTIAMRSRQISYLYSRIFT